MAGKDQYTTKDFIDAIPGTGGIITTIAQKVGCSWNTAKKYIDNHATVQQAYDDECESNLDVAEIVILKNIRSGDSADAKWYLTKKGKHRGYVDNRIEQDLNVHEVVIKYADSDNTPDPA